MKEALFVYGTLKDPEIQRAVFGRATAGTPATLEGFIKSQLQLGKNMYPVITSGEGAVEGVVLELTRKEMKNTDRYETDAYKRVKLILSNGREAWVYQKNEEKKKT